MRGIILAAGRGSRLKILSSDLPKCMISLKGKSLLEYQINSMAINGISEIAVITGYLGNKINHRKITKKYENQIWKETNMVYSLSMADEWLSKYDCIVSYGDIFYDKKAISELSKSRDDISITYDKNYKELWEKRFIKPLDDLETFVIDRSKYILEIGNKPKNFDKIMGQFMGLLKISPKGWKDIKSLISLNEIKRIDMTEMLNLLILREYKIKAVGYDGLWGEVDVPSDIKLYESLHELI